MTPGALVLARDGDANATAAATALWTAIEGRVGEAYAGAALDLIGQHVGTDTEVPDSVLRESVVRVGLFLRNTEGPASQGMGLTSFKSPGEHGGEWGYQSEFHGSALRRSGVMGLLSPWRTKRAGAI